MRKTAAGLGAAALTGLGAAEAEAQTRVRWDKEAVHKWSQCPPPGRSVNMNRLGAALLGEVSDPPIRSLFVFGANPVASTPNAARSRTSSPASATSSPTP